MTPLSALLNDVFTFVCFLEANDVKPRGVRFLPPSALTQINQQLLVSEQLEPLPRSSFGGKRGARELDTGRIRLIHFLCEAARLVTLTGDFLKPTPRLARWLNASEPERAAQLFDAAFLSQSDRAQDDLWRAYRLPGWQLDSPSEVVASLCNILREAPFGEHIKLKTISRLIPPTTSAEEPDAQPDKILRSVLVDLESFDAIEWHGRSAIQITDLGALLLRRSDAPTPPAASQTRANVAALVGEHFEARLNGDWPILYELSHYAELLSMQPLRTYRLDHARIRRALEHGTTLDHILRFLESATGDVLHGAIVATLQRWAQELRRVTLRHATLLEVRDPVILTQLTRQEGVRACIQRTLSSRAVVVRNNRIPSLIRHLERRGLTPRVEFPRPTTHASRPSFDQATLAYLYLSLQLCHQLSDLIPPAYRTPYSILLDLEQQLDPHDRDLAAELADECASHILQPRLPKLLSGDDDAQLPVTDTVASIQRAIDSGIPLELVYYSPYRDEVTTRVVEPHRIEWHGQTPYLIAYCRLDQDERTFRIDRIRGMKNVE